MSVASFLALPKTANSVGRNRPTVWPETANRLAEIGQLTNNTLETNSGILSLLSAATQIHSSRFEKSHFKNALVLSCSSFAFEEMIASRSRCLKLARSDKSRESKIAR